MMPRAGGQYVYLREAFSPLWGFLYGWTLFLVIQTGTIAAVAVGFARYFGVLWPSIAEDHYLVAADPHQHGLRAVALDHAARRRPADRAADLDEHARPQVRTHRPERVYHRQDRRRSSGSIVVGLLLGWNHTAVADNFGQLWVRRGFSDITPGLSAATAFGLFVADLRVANRLAVLGRRVEQHHLHRRRGAGTAPQRATVSRAGHVDRHRPVPARQRRLSRDAAVRAACSTRRRIASPRRRSMRSFPAPAP